MPKECLHCGFVAVDETVCQCPACASERMRFSVLAGLQMKETGDEPFQKKQPEAASAWPERLLRGAMFFLAAQLAGAAMLAAAVFTLPEELLPKKLAPLDVVEAFATEQPQQARLAALLIPIAAALGATVFTLRGMYLAQQAAAVLGPLAAAGLAYQAALLGLPAPPAFLALAALSAAVLCFLAGLRVGKAKRWMDEPTEPALDYKPIDAWDRTAKPNQQAVPIPMGRRWSRLKWGIVGTAVVGPILWFFFRAIAGGEFSVYGGPLALSRLCALEFMVGFIGGTIAGSGTRNGFSQGLFCGLGGAGLRVGLAYLGTAKLPNLMYAGKLALTWKLVHATGLLLIPGAILGGIFGRYALPANAVVRGKKVEKLDDFNYVGSPAPKRTIVLPERV